MASSLENGTQTAVSNAAVQVIAANDGRAALILTNVGTGTVRVGAAAVTASTGIPLAPNQTLTFSGAECPANAVFAIRQDATDSTVFATEVD